MEKILKNLYFSAIDKMDNQGKLNESLRIFNLILEKGYITNLYFFEELIILS